MESNKSYHSGNSHFSGVLIFGILLIAAGVLLLGFNMGWLDAAWRPILLSWQMLLIVIGLIQLSKKQFTAGAVVLLVGLFFIIPRIAHFFPELLPFDGTNLRQLILPFLLILVGIIILLGLINKHKITCFNTNNNNRKNEAPGWLEKNIVFGGTREIVLDPVFKGGNINVVFGGIEVDLRNTTLPEGETVLEANVVFGGIEIFVPDDWYIEMRFSTIFGGYDDKRHAQEPSDHSRKLIIKGNCFFGGGEIK